MNNLTRILFCGILLIAGCASNRVSVIYYSDPSGAALYCDDKVMGYTPFKVIYPLPPELKNERYVKTLSTKVVWASGASTSVDFLTLDRDINSDFQFTFYRPDVPGREIDANFALQLERNRILEQQAQAQRNQAFWQMYNAMQNQNRQSYTPTYTPPPPRRPLNCTSRQVGDTVYTDCY